jgi:hypothetical protein
MGTLIGKMIWIVANGTFSFTVSGLLIRAGRLRSLSTGIIGPCVGFLFIKFSVGHSLVGGMTFVLSVGVINIISRRYGSEPSVFHAFEQSRRLVKSDVGRGVNGHPKLIVHRTRTLIWMDQASELGHVRNNLSSFLQFHRCSIDAINELSARLSRANEKPT